MNITSDVMKLIDALYDTESGPEKLGKVNFEKALEDVRNFHIGSQINQMAKKSGNISFPDFFAQFLKSHQEQILFQNMFIRAEQKRIYRCLDEAGIQAIPLKGIELSERYFGYFAARGTTDIDLLINGSDVNYAIEKLKEIGYEVYEEESDSDHYHVQLNRFFDNPMFPFIGIELHWNITRAHHSDTDIGLFWKNSQPIEGYDFIRSLSDEDFFYHVCLHGYHHHMLSFKYFLDIAQIAQVGQANIQLEALLKRAKADNNYKKLLVVLSLVTKKLPATNSFIRLKKRIFWPFWSEKLMQESTVSIRSFRYYSFQFFTTFVSSDSAVRLLNKIRFLLFPPVSFAGTYLKINTRGPAALVYYRLYKSRFQMLKRSFAKKTHKELDTP